MAEFDMAAIKSNSNKSKEAPKVQKKHVPIVKKGDIVSSKKSFKERIISTFLDDDIGDIKQWLIKDVLIPGVKETLLDLVSMAMFGETNRRSKKRRYDDRGRVNYGGYYSEVNYGRRNRRNSRERNRYYEEPHKDYDYRAITLGNRSAAEEIVDRLRDEIRDEGSASIASFFELLNVPSSPNDNNWGWTREGQIGIRSTRDGFLIDVDEAEYIG